MSTDSSERTEDICDPPDPEDVPAFEGQVVFKGDFESDDIETVHKENE